MVFSDLYKNKHSLNNFESIYKENYPKMFCIALKMINDEDAVWDILQDIFIYYYKKTNNGSLIHQPKSWLMRATINKCIDFNRLKIRHADIDEAESKLVCEDSVEKDSDLTMLRLALSKLNTIEKTVALLYGEGMSYREISEISGVKFSSVGKMISRTIKKLDKILNKLNYEMY